MIWGGIQASNENNLAWTTYSAGAFCLIFAFLSRFKKIKGLGIEAELWEEKMEEAEKLIDRLRSLSLAITEPLLMLLIRVGRLGSSIPKEEQIRMIKEIDLILKGIGLSEEMIDRPKKDWHKYNALDLAFKILEIAKDQCKRQQELIDQKFQQLPSPLPAGTPEFQEHSELVNAKSKWQEVISYIKNEALKPDEPILVYERVITSLGKIGRLNQEIEKKLRDNLNEELKDLKHYADTKEFRRPDSIKRNVLQN